jgi:hypothetical protein
MNDVPSQERWRTLGVKPPSKPASRIDSLRFVRDLNLRVSMCMVPAVLAALFFASQTWVLAVVLLGFLVVVGDVVYLSVRIRRSTRH